MENETTKRVGDICKQDCSNTMPQTWFIVYRHLIGNGKVQYLAVDNEKYTHAVYPTLEELLAWAITQRTVYQSLVYFLPWHTIAHHLQ